MERGALAGAEPEQAAPLGRAPCPALCSGARPAQPVGPPVSDRRTQRRARGGRRRDRETARSGAPRNETRAGRALGAAPSGLRPRAARPPAPLPLARPLPGLPAPARPLGGSEREEFLEFSLSLQARVSRTPARPSPVPRPRLATLFAQTPRSLSPGSWGSGTERPFSRPPLRGRVFPQLPV